MKKVLILAVTVLGIAFAVNILAAPVQLYAPKQIRDLTAATVQPLPAIPPAITASLAINQHIVAFDKTIILKSITNDGTQFVVEINGTPSTITIEEPGVVDSGYFPAHNLRFWPLGIDLNNGVVLFVVGVMQ